MRQESLSLSYLLARAARMGGDVKHVSDVYYELSWAELEDRASRSAALLQSLGVKAGDRVAVLMNNSVRLFELIFAITRAGGVFVPVNTRFAGPEILACLADCGANILLLQPSFTAAIEALDLAETDISHIIFCPIEAKAEPNDKLPHDKRPDGWLSYDTLFAAAEPAKDAGRSGSDVAAIFYTSGTTGRAKGVMLTHGGIVINEMQWITALGLGSDDNIMIIAPMFHAAGSLNAIGAAALTCSVYFVGTFDIGVMLATIEERQITKIGLIVVMLEMIGRYPQLADYDLSSVTRISYGGSPITESALETAQSVFPSAGFYQIYGQTEGGPTVSILPADLHIPGSPVIRSAGLPVIGTSVRIIDEDGQEAPPQVIGEICVSGPGVSPGYWNLEAETESSFVDGYLKTGDAGYMDENGFIYICDRVKDMVISGGENVYPSEVENALMKYDGMVECAVISIPSDKWGEQVHAIVRLADGAGASEAELTAHCRKWLAGYKIPRSYAFWTEPLPVSPSAKILKTKLREPYWKGHKRRI